MREKILKRLMSSDEIKKIGASEKTVRTYVDKFIAVLPETEDGITDEFLAPHVAMILAMEGDINHRVAEAVKKNLTPPAPPKPGEEKPKQGEGITLEAIQEMMKNVMSPLTSELAELKRKETVRGIVSAARQIVNTKYKPSSSRAALVENCFERVTASIAEDATAEKIAEAWKEEYDGILKLTSLTDGYEPAEGSGGGSSFDWKKEAERIKSSGLVKSEKVDGSDLA